MFQIAAQWHHSTAAHTLLLGDTNSQHRCCGEDHYAGLNHFQHQTDSNQQPDHNPSITKQRHDYHTHSRAHHRYYDDDYYRPNRLKYFDYRSQPTKYSYHKEYYTRKYNNAPYLERKHIQNRRGFVFPDTHSNTKEGRGGYRPYIPDSYFQDHRYHKNNDYNNFRNRNGHGGFNELPHNKQRQKHRPGLLGVSLGTSRAVAVTGPDGYKHVIHNLPPWTELDSTPERIHYQESFPVNMDARGGLEHPGSHRFSTRYHESPQVYNHQNNPHQTYKQVPIYFGSSDKKNDSQFPAVYKNSLQSHNINRNQEQGPAKDTSGILHQTDERLKQNYPAPPKPDKFHPSPPFYKYSEPDPLYHPNGSPLQTYLSTEVTQPPSTTPSNTSITSKIRESTLSPMFQEPLKYPDSINVQLPPAPHDSDTRVPYVAVTEVTEQTPHLHLTVATQASDATHEKSLIRILPTKPSVYSSTESEVPSSTLKVQAINIKENTIFFPTSLIQDTSTHSEPTEVSVYPIQRAHTDTSIKTEHFLPTMITEKSDINPHQSILSQIFYTTEQSHNTMNHNTAPSTSPQECLNVKHKSDTKKTSVTNDTKNTENKNYNADVYVTAVTLLQSSSHPDRLTVVSNSDITDTAMPTETSTMTTTAATETVYNSTISEAEEISHTIQSLKSDSEDIQPTVETDKTEQVTKNDIMDTLPNKSNLHIESTVTKRVPLMLNQLQTLVSHTQSLNYLHHDSSTTVTPMDESE
jgi:hypothetical protein